MKQQHAQSRIIAMYRRLREKLYDDVKADILAHPEQTYSDIAQKFLISVATVQRVAQRNNISRPVGPRPKTGSTSTAHTEADNE